MGPVPPDGSPPNVPADAGVAPPGAKGDRLQRAFEAEMVLFLREQSTKLQEEVEQLRNLHRAKDTPGAAMSTPSPLRHGKLLMEVWALGLGIVVYMLEVPMRSHEHVRGATPQGDGLYGGGDPPVHTPRGRSPTTRRLQALQQVRFTPNGTRIPFGPPSETGCTSNATLSH